MTRTDTAAKRGIRNPGGFILSAATSIGRAMLFAVSLGLLAAAPVASEPLPPAALNFAPDEFSPSPLEDLLSVPDQGVEWNDQAGDEALVAAVAQGNDPDLEPLDPFRKRKLDLFSTERPVVIGRSEMLLRLRVRASRKETMSVELHF